MKDETTHDEMELLLSAGPEGRIPFPEGTADTVSRLMKTLILLEGRGCVYRKRSKGCRFYFLTPTGHSLRAGLLANHAR